MLDGDTLYYDRNGNGDLTEADEKVALPKFDVMDTGFVKGNRQHHIGTITAWPKRNLTLTIMQTQIRPGAKDAPPQEQEIIKLLGEVPDGILTGVIIAGEGVDVGGKPRVGPQQPQVAMADQTCALCFADRPQHSPIVHFYGPLQMTLHPMQTFVPGEQAELKSGLGTPGLGKGTFVMAIYQGTIPDDAHPTAEIEFPPAGPGKEPRRLKLTLDKRC